MAESFMGLNVTIKCDAGGVYQGKIKEVDSTAQTLTIESPYHNGKKSDFSEITLSSNNILDISIHESFDIAINRENAVNQITSSACLQSNSDQGRYRYETGARKSQRNFSTPIKGYKHEQQPPQKNRNQGSGVSTNFHRNECFEIDHSEMNTDFDFEKNLALFDKLAVYDEMNLPKPKKFDGKYRHDENVLHSDPIVYRQIVVQKNSTNNAIPEYYTDNGLVIPTVTWETNKTITETAVNLGFSKTRQIEIFGVNAGQMALTVLGGTNRLHPRNAHQTPHIVVLCGPHDTGAKGVATARHLANQNVNVCVFLADFVKITECLQGELRLLSLTNAKLINVTSELPTTPIDLIILAMDSNDCLYLRQQPWHRSVVSWCSNAMAPVLCLCPPSKLEIAEIDIKWCVCDVLPYSLDKSYGAIYLLDTGLPARAYQVVGITYKSPFCSKTCIALHRNKT